jgi:hypothetical protein
MEKEKRLYEQVKHLFTDEEIQHMGEALARENQNLLDIRDAKSSAAAAFAAQMKEAGMRASIWRQRLTTSTNIAKSKWCRSWTRRDPA